MSVQKLEEACLLTMEREVECSVSKGLTLFLLVKVHLHALSIPSLIYYNYRRISTLMYSKHKQ